ncbi:caspase domain-containing protein [Kitasatospora sp. NPDC101176]|uniref:caspase family protein n=1 Tax=Kitasatospora sp. NPDC101176 TaxID=3364099 RepID=UPI00381B0960
MTDRPEPPDFANSRAILIGTGTYRSSGFQPLPAALNSLTAVEQVLTDPRLCGWPPDRITAIPDPSDIRELLPQLRELARETRGVLLLYYVGHGVILPRGQLCLTLTDTNPDHPDAGGLVYDRVREVFLDSPAKVKVVVLDCCYSGRAIEALAAGAAPAGAAHIRGAYILVASDRAAHVVPLSEQAEATTSFTGTLLELIRDGMPGGPVWLTLGALYPHLQDRLRQRALPPPNQLGTDSANLFAFTRNAAHRSPFATALAAAFARGRLHRDVTLEQLAQESDRSPEEVSSYLSGTAIAPRDFVDAFLAALERHGVPLPPGLLGTLHELRLTELRESPLPAVQVVYLQEVTEQLRQEVTVLTRERDDERRGRLADRALAVREASRLAARLTAEEARSRRLQESSEEKDRRLAAAVAFAHIRESDLVEIRREADSLGRELGVLRLQVQRLMDPADGEPSPPADADPVVAAAAPSPVLALATAPGPEAGRTAAPVTRPQSAGPSRPRPPRRAPVPVGRVLAQGLLLLIGLSVVGVGFGRFLDESVRVTAHQGAPACGSPGLAAGVDCLKPETGRVTATFSEDGEASTAYKISVLRETASGTETYTVGKRFYDDVASGTEVDLKVWLGHVVETSYHGHRADVPLYDRWEMVLVALLIGVGTTVAVLGGVLARLENPGVLWGAPAVIGFTSWMGSSIFVQAELSPWVTMPVGVLCWLISSAAAWGFATV